MLPYYDGTKRMVRVYVPEHEDGETFPVVYMTDGQNLFEDDTVQFGCWYTREAVRAEQQKYSKAAVIVGIHNDDSPFKRTMELTPKMLAPIYFPPEVPQPAREHFKPEGELFADFVVNVVMPEIESLFPVKTGRDNTAFCGSSMGGLESFFVALSYPDKFSYAGVFSPAFEVYVKDSLDEGILLLAKHALDNAPFLYFYVGGADEQEKILAADMERVYDIMRKVYPADKLKNVIIPENKHHESAWQPVFQELLHLFLYS